MKRTLGITLILASALTLIGVSGAFGGNVVEIESTTRISEKFPAFHGRVLSDNSACTKQRRVRLFRSRNGLLVLLGTDLTNNKGRWAVTEDEFNLTSGAYYAKVMKRSEGAAGTTYVCLADRSRTVVVD